MTERIKMYNLDGPPESTFEDMNPEDLVPYILWCHRDETHHLCFTDDPQHQSVEIAGIVLEKIKTLGGGHVSDLRNAVREALNHLLMTHPLVSRYFVQ